MGMLGTCGAGMCSMCGPPARGLSPQAAADFITAQVGTGLATAESVRPACAVLAAAGDDPWQACLVPPIFIPNDPG